MSLRILIAEEALRDRQGHWFEYCRAARAAFIDELGAQVDIAGHRTMQASVQEELSATPWFRYTVWDHIYQSPNALKRYCGTLQHNWRTYRDFDRLVRERGPYDVLFAPTVVLHHLLAFERLTRKQAEKQVGETVMLIRNNIASYDDAGRRRYGRTAAAWRWAIQRFRPLLKRNVARFITDSSRLADEYEELTGIRFGVVPHPQLLPSAGIEQGTDVGTVKRPIRLFLPGPARHEKGVDLLLQAVERLQARRPDQAVEVVLQWAEPFAMPDGTMLGPDDVQSNGGVRYHTIRQPLSSSEYLAELQSADVIVLPYRRCAYFARISGVAVEAMCLGKPLICTNDTWLSDTAGQFGLGIAVKDESVDELVEALERVVQNLGALTSEARSKVDEVRQFFSASTFAALVAGRGADGDKANRVESREQRLVTNRA
ncbi:MAG TPA: glycosyltransferase [Caulifigura sp.]|nr:glycosyltransferase [Caulifigura sp.]